MKLKLCYHFITADEDVTGGNIKVSAKYGIIPVYSNTLDLCDTAQEAGLKCPFGAGKHSLKITENIPGEVPSVSTTIFILNVALSACILNN